MHAGQYVILSLKLAVIAVTVLLIASIVAIIQGKRRLHGRINLAFFILTMVAVLGLEVVVRVIKPDVFDYFNEATRRALRIHLMFSIPATFLLPVMYLTGWAHRRRLHLTLAFVFVALWIGTFVTGVFFLPHD